MQGQMNAMPYMQQMGYNGMGMGQMGMGQQGGMGGYGIQGYGPSRGGGYQQNGGMQQAGGNMGGGSMGMGGGGTGQRRMDADHIEGKLFLGGLDNNTSKQSLLDYVTQWGEVSDYVLMDGRGFGFVTYADPAHAQAFLEQREHIIDGKRVEAKAAVPKNSKSTPGLTKKMFVGGTGEVSDDDFKAYFDQFGDIEDCVVLRKEDGTSRGFGFVTFRDEISVEKCLVMQHSLNGKTVELKRAVKKEEMAGGGMYGDGSYGGAGGGYGGGGYGGGGGVGPMRGGGGGTRQNDWLCPVDTCRNKNFGWREACNRCQAPKPENPKSAMVTQETRPSGGSGYARSQGNDMSSGGGGGGYDQSGMGMGAGMSSMGMGGMQGMGQMGQMGMGGMAMAPMGYGMGYGMSGMAGMGQMGMGGMQSMQGMGQMGQMGAQAGMGYSQQGQQGYGSQGAGYGRTQGGRGYSSGGGQQSRYRPY